MTKVVVSGFIIVLERDLPSVLAELPHHIALTRREPGCISFEVWQDDAMPNRFNVREAFGSQSAFDAHQARIRTSKWGEVSVNVERHYNVEVSGD